jgi:UDP-N-acetylglucosamine acyltransferase
MAQVHASAIVDAAAELAPDVQVGAFSIIGPGVRVGGGTSIGSHVVLSGNTTIGRDNRIFPFCSIGTEPQDKKYAGEATSLEIGDGNMIREYCLINTGTVQGGATTRVGSDNWIMAYAHIGHDCQVGDSTIIANGVQLGGHVKVGDWAFIAGTSAVHQFVRVGAHAMCGGGTMLQHDLPPYMIAFGFPAKDYGVHLEGLRRRNFPAAQIAALRHAHQLIYRQGLPLTEARAALDKYIAEQPEDVAGPLRELARFLAETGRGIVR